MEEPLRYIKINQTLDSEHEEIFDSLQRIYELCDSTVINKKQHQQFKKDMIAAIKDAYRVSKKHWVTEQRYFDDGVKMQPLGHKGTDKKIQEHIQEHNSNLDKLKKFCQYVNSLEFVSKNDMEDKLSKMKKFTLHLIKKIIYHINEMDDKHFSHWVKSTNYE